jgi:hypothetical protein
MQLRKAERRKAKMKMAIHGPSGSGKTYSALLMAFGLSGNWKKVAVIDTENNSADLYAHLGDFQVIELNKPFSPQRYEEAIGACEKAGMEVVIIDSLSHEWEAEGGILETHSKMSGNSFTNWAKITPAHNSLMRKMLGINAHVIGTYRTKQDYILADKGGKMVPEKVGLKAVAREGTDFEYTLVFDLDISHQAKVSKDRTGMFSNQLPFALSENTGKRIQKWCEVIPNEENLLHMLYEAENEKQLRQLYTDHDSFQHSLRPQFIKHWKSVVKPQEITENGANT